MEYKNGILTITERCDKIRVIKGEWFYNHTKGLDNSLPLPFGDGTYTVELLKHSFANRYKRIGTRTISAVNTEAYMLKPNAYVPVTDAWGYAKELCQGLEGEAAYKEVCSWVRNHILYDYVKAIRTPKNTANMPDPAACWETRFGICTDIASMTVGMLRSVSVPSRLVMGKANRQNHAWVEAVIDGKAYRFDHPTRADTYTKERWY